MYCLQGEVLLGGEEVVLGPEDARGLDLQAPREAPWGLVGRGPWEQPHAAVRSGTLPARAAALVGFGVGVGGLVLDGRPAGRGLPSFGDSIARHCGTAVDARSSFEAVVVCGTPDSRLGVEGGD